MSSKAKTLARRLLRKNRGTRKITARSWRQIAREDYGDERINGTLCRFALSDGEWIPKSSELQIALGLKRARAPRTQCTSLHDMATSTLREMLIHRETMPDPDPRIIKQFVKLGWMKRTRTVAR